MLICILTKNVITSCSVTMMLFLHLEVKPLMTLTTVLYLSCALISGHLAMMLMELTKRRWASFLVVFNRPINILCRVSLFLSMALCLLLRLFVFRLLFLNDSTTTEIYALSLHDALPIYAFVGRVGPQIHHAAARALQVDLERVAACVLVDAGRIAFVRSGVIEARLWEREKGRNGVRPDQLSCKQERERAHGRRIVRPDDSFRHPSVIASTSTP